MVKYIALAVLVLMSGCAANHTDNNGMTAKQVRPNQTTTNQTAPNSTRISTHSQLHTRSHDYTQSHIHAQNTTRTKSPNHVITQASSTSTHNRVSMKETNPGDVASDLLKLIQPPAGNKQGQAPVTNNPNQAPVNNNPNQPPAGNRTGTNQPPTGFPGMPSQSPTGTPAGSNQAPTGGTTGEKTPTGSTGQTQGTKDSSQFAKQVLDLVNQQRSKAGLNSLDMNDDLSKVAMVKAQDMYNNNYFDHNSPTHGSPFDMMKEYGISFNYAGENIAKGQTTPSQVMNDWMNSPGHKANILNKSYTKIGIAFYNNEWVQEFTG